MINIVIEKKLPSPKRFSEMRVMVGWEEHEEVDIELAFRKTLFGVVASINNEIVGTGRIIGDEGLFYYIQDVFVIPKYQNLGFGKTIMNELMKYIESNKKSGLFVGLMSAKGKEDFYKKYGFIARPTDECGSGMFKEY